MAVGAPPQKCTGAQSRRCSPHERMRINAYITPSQGEMESGAAHTSGHNPIHSDAWSEIRLLVNLFTGSPNPLPDQPPTQPPTTPQTPQKTTKTQKNNTQKVRKKNLRTPLLHPGVLGVVTGSRPDPVRWQARAQPHGPSGAGAPGVPLCCALLCRHRRPRHVRRRPGLGAWPRSWRALLGGQRVQPGPSPPPCCPSPTMPHESSRALRWVVAGVMLAR